MSLGLVKGGQTSTKNSSIDSRNLVEALTRHVEANELTDMSRVETKRSYGSDCARYVSVASKAKGLDCYLLIASGIWVFVREP